MCVRMHVRERARTHTHVLVITYVFYIVVSTRDQKAPTVGTVLVEKCMYMFEIK